MTIEISARIEGNFEFDNPTDELWFDGRRCLLYKESGLCYIAFRIDVKNPASYYPDKLDAGGNSFSEFEKLDVFKEAISLFQYFESSGSISFNVEKIYWTQPRIRFIPQTEQEKQQFGFFQQSKIKVYNEATTIVDWNSLSSIVNYRNNFEQFNLPFSFYREGYLAFQNGENRRAFLMYYMMLELLYIDENETSHDRTKRKFAQSSDLTKAIELVLETIRQPEFKVHFEWMQAKCQLFQKQFDVDGFHHILVKMRGSLAHGLEKSSSFIFKEHELYTLAFLTGCVAKYVCGLMQINSFKTR